jgi:hypothetical protein
LELLSEWIPFCANLTAHKAKQMNIVNSHRMVSILLFNVVKIIVFRIAKVFDPPHDAGAVKLLNQVEII